MYLGYQNNKIKYYVSEPFEEPTIDKWEETEDEYVVEGDEYVIKDAAWEQREAARERQRLDMLTLTPADVERALYKAEGMDFADLQAFIAQQLPQIDTKALAIEFRAKDFYRGAEANGVRLFDTIGALLGYKIPEDMDYLFENKELPEKPQPEPEPEPEPEDEEEENNNSETEEPAENDEENIGEDNSSQEDETPENDPNLNTENEDLDNNEGEQENDD